MASGSTASSDSDAEQPAESEAARSEAPESPAAEAGAAAVEHDQARRAFFKEFGKQAITTVGQVAGMADIVSRTGTSAAANLLGLDETTFTGQTRRPTPTRPKRDRAVTRTTVSTGADVEDSFRSAYRLEDDAIIMLDQRTVPDAIEEVICRRGSDVAYHLRTGAIRGGPVMAQVAAYGLAATARERQGKPADGRDAELRRTRNALATARPSSRMPAWAMARMEAARTALPAGASGIDVADALRAEADAIATRFQADHLAIVGHLIDVLPEPEERPLQVLVHGAPGAIAGGLFGTVLTALARIAESERELIVHVTETRPFMEGARLAAWELRQSDVGHRVIADSAVTWLLEREPIDAVLLAPETIAADGSMSGVVGSASVVHQARAATGPTEGHQPLIVVAGSSVAIDADIASRADLPTESRPPREINSYLAGVHIGTAEASVPAVDVVPADAIDVLITEHGAMRPPTPSALRSIAPVVAQAES